MDDFSTVLYAGDTGLGDTAGHLFTLGDTDLDELPDLFVVSSTGSAKTVRVLPNGYGETTATYTLDVAGVLLDIRVNDYDGDGRGDLWLWDAEGRLTIRLGNSRLPGVVPSSWHNAPGWECDPEYPPYAFDGYFRDDDGNIHESNIETIADLGITLGCNPPYNDDYCPDREITRGEMAAFLVRALSLGDDGGADFFVDDDESVFESDINKLAAAGITTGCNPPAFDEFCPEDTVNRGAPHLVFTHAPEGNPVASSASTIALAYLELAAPSLGLGACWAGYTQAAAGQWPPLKEALGLPEGHVGTGAMMVGQPRYRYHRLPARREPSVTWR